MRIVNVTTGRHYRFSSYAFAQRCWHLWGRSWDWRRDPRHGTGYAITAYCEMTERGTRWAFWTG